MIVTIASTYDLNYLLLLLYILKSRFPTVANKQMLTRPVTLTGGDWCARRDLNSEHLHPKCSASAKLRHGHINSRRLIIKCDNLTDYYLKLRLLYPP